MYLYRLESEMLLKGNKYSPKRTVLISFNNYRNEEIPNLKMANYILMDQINNLKKYDIDAFEIYLPVYQKMRYNELNEIDKRLYLLGIGDVSKMEELELSKEDIKLVKDY